MNEVVLAVNDVSKLYRIFKSPRHRLLHFVFPWLKTTYATHDALKGINLTMRRGEALAVIGANGAGKSTLLKLLAGIAKPTAGRISTTGTVGAIVELGLGFHPDFSGRNNARAALVMQGSTRREAETQVIDIQQFAELGEYFDRPVRTYSSGMQARLAFATATSIKPDILIVDEVLSVGDAYFQGKSIRRIEALLATGTSLLFVSHDLAAVKRLCNRAILLSHGSLVADGPVMETLDQYNALLARTPSPNTSATSAQPDLQSDESILSSNRSGDGRVRVQTVSVLNEHRVAASVLTSSAPFSVRVVAKVVESVDELCLGISVRDRLGQTLYGTNTYHHSLLCRDLKAGDTVTANFNMRTNLGEGQYLVSVSAHRGAVHTEGNFDWLDNCASFEVINAGRALFIGSANLEARVDLGTAGEQSAPTAQRLRAE